MTPTAFLPGPSGPSLALKHPIGEASLLANPQPLEPLLIDEPTLAMIFTVTAARFPSGKEGQLPLARSSRTGPAKRFAHHVSIAAKIPIHRSLSASRPCELQRATLIATMRREGF